MELPDFRALGRLAMVTAISADGVATLRLLGNSITDTWDWPVNRDSDLMIRVASFGVALLSSASSSA